MNGYDLEGTLTLFYYDDLGRAFNFYSDIIGFDFVADFGYVKIFRVIEGALLGLVDGHAAEALPADAMWERRSIEGRVAGLRRTP